MKFARCEKRQLGFIGCNDRRDFKECRRIEEAELEEFRLIGNVKSTLSAACAFMVAVGINLAVVGLVFGTWSCLGVAVEAGGGLRIQVVISQVFHMSQRVEDHIDRLVYASRLRVLGINLETNGW